MNTWKDEVKRASFINETNIKKVLSDNKEPAVEDFERVLEKAKKQEELTMAEVAILLNTEDKASIKKMYKVAKDIKKKVYGNRVVLFAPLYLGNKCTNSCTYCGFNVKNKIERMTLEKEQIKEEVHSLITKGHKRLIMVYGTHPDYSPEYIRDSVCEAYKVKDANGEIRRININASPHSVEEYKVIKEAEIGTYQIFQETYHQETYKKVHPRGEKSNYKWRLFGLSRAMEAGIDDVGIGVLFGLYDWKFEVMGLMNHVRHLEREYGVGPHTISFPRLKEAVGNEIDDTYFVSDDELKRIITILRLSVPYTGLILTAREEANLRRECMELGVSQIDAGTQIELQAYSHKDGDAEQELEKAQFKIGDTRSLDETMQDLFRGGFVPSFCTACYRLNRTGEHFMEFSKPGFIHNYCNPNAVLTLAEYLEDYAAEETKKLGYQLIEREISNFPTTEENKDEVRKKLQEIKNGVRDIIY